MISLCFSKSIHVLSRRLQLYDAVKWYLKSWRGGAFVLGAWAGNLVPVAAEVTTPTRYRFVEIPPCEIVS